MSIFIIYLNEIILITTFAGLIFVDKTFFFLIFFEQRKLSSYQTAIKTLDALKTYALKKYVSCLLQYHYNLWKISIRYLVLNISLLNSLIEIIETPQKPVLVDYCFFSYVHGYGEELLNPKESICEKTHLVRIHLQEWILIYQENFEYFAKINVLVWIIFKISRECNLTNESQIHGICENIFWETL